MKIYTTNTLIHSIYQYYLTLDNTILSIFTYPNTLITTYKVPLDHTPNISIANDIITIDNNTYLIHKSTIYSDTIPNTGINIYYNDIVIGTVIDRIEYHYIYNNTLYTYYNNTIKEYSLSILLISTISLGNNTIIIDSIVYNRIDNSRIYSKIDSINSIELDIIDISSIYYYNNIDSIVYILYDNIVLILYNDIVISISIYYLEYPLEYTKIIRNKDINTREIEVSKGTINGYNGIVEYNSKYYNIFGIIIELDEYIDGNRVYNSNKIYRYMVSRRIYEYLVVDNLERIIDIFDKIEEYNDMHDDIFSSLFRLLDEDNKDKLICLLGAREKRIRKAEYLERIVIDDMSLFSLFLESAEKECKLYLVKRVLDFICKLEKDIFFHALNDLLSMKMYYLAAYLIVNASGEYLKEGIVSSSNKDNNRLVRVVEDTIEEELDRDNKKIDKIVFEEGNKELLLEAYDQVNETIETMEELGAETVLTAALRRKQKNNLFIQMLYEKLALVSQAKEEEF
ncbi:hypothetical protein NEOKW01_1176 [Nematocida sp. AWRm80]|nr:hypothetical protein NEOKW01_1176 [Nematocida sp. AWRm80]